MRYMLLINSDESRYETMTQEDQRALELTDNAAERRFLQQRLVE